MSRISSVETADTSYLGTRSSSSVYSQQPTRIPSVKFMTPHPSRANHDLHNNSYRQPYHVYPSTEGPMIDAGTNDFPIAHSLATGRPLPYGQFKTVSLLLESPKRGDILGWNRKAQDYRIPVSATARDHAPLATHFKPFVPHGAENTEEKFEGSVQKSRSYLLELLDIPVRKPPVQFKPTKNKEMMGPSTKPPNHRGIVWPLAFATEPPYTTPGHEVPGVKQPVGVLQTRAPPPRPVRDGAGGLEGGDIPDWISPLYTTFGIGGPYGRNGPFYTPRVMPTPRDQWANLVREAAASRTSDVPVPAIVKKDKRPDIESLCDDYMFVKRQQDLEARRCRICLKFKEFIAKIERKLGLYSHTMRRQKQVQGQQQVQKSGQISKATSFENKDQPVINNSYPTKNMESKITSNDSLSNEFQPRVLEQLLYASPTISLLSLEEGELERQVTGPIDSQHLKDESWKAAVNDYTEDVKGPD